MMRMREGFTIIELLVVIFILALGAFIILFAMTLSSVSYAKSNTRLENSFNEFTSVTTGIAGNEEALDEPASKISLKEFLNTNLDELDVIEVWLYSDGRKILVLKRTSF